MEKMLMFKQLCIVQEETEQESSLSTSAHVRSSMDGWTQLSISMLYIQKLETNLYFPTASGMLQ